VIDAPAGNWGVEVGELVTVGTGDGVRVDGGIAVSVGERGAGVTGAHETSKETTMIRNGIVFFIFLFSSEQGFENFKVGYRRNKFVRSIEFKQ
jgi:hypothetical protein